MNFMGFLTFSKLPVPPEHWIKALRGVRRINAIGIGTYSSTRRAIGSDTPNHHARREHSLRQVHEPLGFYGAYMSKVIHVDFQLARKFRIALSDAQTLRKEKVSFDIVPVLEKVFAEIREHGLPVRHFHPDRWDSWSEVPENPVIVQLDVETPSPELMDSYREEIIDLQSLDLSPDELEVELLDLMRRAKQDGVDLNKLCGPFRG